MFKRMISLSIMIILIFSTSVVSAEVGYEAEVKVYDKGLYINSEKIINYHSLYPYFIYNDILYVPLTVQNSHILGFVLKWDEETRTITVTSGESTRDNYKEPWMKHDWKTIEVHKSDIKVIINDKEYIPKEFPVFEFNYIAYVPLTFTVVHDYFGWDLCYNPFTGVYISSEEGVSALSTFDEYAFEYDKALAEYARSINSELSEEDALNLIMLIKEKCALYDMDELLIFATIWQESNFNSKDYYQGAIGLMQIMKSTGASAGLTPEMLYDPEINVDFGVRYLKDKLDTYKGSEELALSAYNQGITRVNRGNYSTRYYNNVMAKKAKVEAYLSEKGLISSDVAEQVNSDKAEQ